MRFPTICLFTLALTFEPQRALGWGQEGHRLVAAIAAKNLKPAAAARVKALLAEGETLESISSWADRVRPERPETSTWHFINLTVTESRAGSSQDQWKPFCPQTGCVVSTIGEMVGRLSNDSLDSAKKAEALKFLVHFVGDLHQPLHSGDNRDRGGNDVPVIYRERATNMHSIWDTPMVMDWLSANPALKAKLEAGPGFWARRSMSKGTVEDWAWEAHDIARDLAYGGLPTTRPAQIGGQ
jgi:hypothetical protein